MKNLNLLFNKTYYAALECNSFSDEAVKNVNEEIYSAAFSIDRDRVIPGKMVKHHFLMETVYPGLLVGIGNSHSTGMSSEEVAVGFSFDYVTGQPYIPGSTVKGVLRSHFKDHPQAVMAITGRDEAWVKKLEADIFDGNDIFFDAVVYDGDEYGLLMGSEFITPHSSPTENPVPIKLIKIRPGVRFEFRFWLHDSEHLGAEQKKTLFQTLLAMFGIGAKTNVGFGILKPDETNGAIKPKKARPVAAATGDNRSGGPARQANRHDQPRPTDSTPSQKQEGAACPHCRRWNNRFNPKSGKENWNWRDGVCYNCKEKIR